MDIVKIGTFLKKLRREKNLTQEQLAEIMNVSPRTVSRWETGRNMPDIDVLIELSELYGIELRELLNGERKDDSMENKELKETVLKVAEYDNELKHKITRNFHIMFILGLAAAITYGVLLFTDRADCFLGGICLGVMCGMMIVGSIMTSKHAAAISEKKMQFLKRCKIFRGKK